MIYWSQPRPWTQKVRAAGQKWAPQIVSPTPTPRYLAVRCSVFSSVSPFPISSCHAQAPSCSSLSLADSALPPGSALLPLLSPLFHGLRSGDAGAFCWRWGFPTATCLPCGVSRQHSGNVEVMEERKEVGEIGV